MSNPSRSIAITIFFQVAYRDYFFIYIFGSLDLISMDASHTLSQNAMFMNVSIFLKWFVLENAPLSSDTNQTVQKAAPNDIPLFTKLEGAQLPL
jgi:hypothetical protein